MPELTVIMPVYNGELFLEEAIESILGQTFSNFSLIIVNDNSTDTTQKIIDKYISLDKRVQSITNNTNFGPAKSRNLAIDAADTEFIALMDADDRAVATRLEKQLDYLKTHLEVGVCGSWFTFFGKENKVVKHDTDHDRIKVGFLRSCTIGNPTVMLRKSSLGNLRFDESMKIAEDYSLWSQLIANTKFHNIPESLLFYRWHSDNMSQTKIENLETSEFSIKAKQLENLGIHPNNPDLEYYVHAVSLKRNQPTESIIKTIKAANKLKESNKEIQYYNQTIFENHIDKTIVRTIRNAKNNNRDFYKYVKKESGFFSKIPKLDAAIFFLKSFFN
ncbi:glycosyltransferase family 2 protein [Aequorivita todarodis]|uniref:glycosyltransferase family 2 protein n=1 Tax=Aequorivita todarodis TaxID=2036821 RepID=UPI0023508B63|nr:glycosyltransferase family 2 protein [Aequorivita todarodis]MDC8000065.1 glycosyltransferase family 2 protein [Aequorivita todarodis]